MKAQIWDTAGQEKFRSVTGAYFRNAVGAMLVYDVTCRSSFENIQKWMKELKEKADPNIVMILVGNKSDLTEKREVKYEEGMRYSEKNCKDNFYLMDTLEIAFIETSALNAGNVDIAFRNLIMEIYKLTKAQMTTAGGQNSTGLGPGNKTSSHGQGNSSHLFGYAEAIE